LSSSFACSFKTMPLAFASSWLNSSYRVTGLAFRMGSSWRIISPLLKSFAAQAPHPAIPDLDIWKESFRNGWIEAAVQRAVGKPPRLVMDATGGLGRNERIVRLCTTSNLSLRAMMLSRLKVEVLGVSGRRSKWFSRLFA
jgi:hypothetical protein